GVGLSLALRVVRHSVAGQGAVEVDIAVDEDFAGNGGAGKRVAVPENEVRVLAYVDGANLVVDADDPGGVEGNHFERFLFGSAAIAHGLGGLLVEAAGEVIRVAFYRDANGFAHRHDRVQRNCVPGCLLVAPPIGEGSDADIFGGEFFGNLIRFQRVVEGANVVAELPGHGDFGFEFVSAIAVDLHQQLS